MILSNRSFHWESCGVPPGLSLRVFIIARRHDPIELREWALPLTKSRLLARSFWIPIIVFSCCVCLMAASSEDLFTMLLPHSCTRKRFLVLGPSSH